jgi:penicillin-binding protein A
MNSSIRRLGYVIVAMFAVLLAFTSRWTIFDKASLNANANNKRRILEGEYFHRGDIATAHGTVIARSVRGAGGAYHRVYPYGSLFANAIGYSASSIGQAGMEAAWEPQLAAAESGTIASLFNRLSGQAPNQGDEVVTTLDPTAQHAAVEGLAGHAGAVVAIEPATGAIRALASSPSFDPNRLTSSAYRAQLNSATDAPLFNRATQASYAPGSTFKVVTAIAAIDSGLASPASVFSGRSPIEDEGRPLSNFSNEQFGDISLTTALTFSVNTVWAQVAKLVGKDRFAHYMAALGFGRKQTVGLPADAVRASGEYANGAAIPPTSDLVDVSRMGIGQDRLEVTPLQMAMVASAVANGGKLMSPRLVREIMEPDGRVARRFAPAVYSHAFSSHTADEVAAMMSKVVQEGTGTAAALSGVEVAGKTGTAETSRPGLNQAWFIGFSPIKSPRIAVAAVVEDSPGEGGTVAAPIVKRVMEAVLRGR